MTIPDVQRALEGIAPVESGTQPPTAPRTDTGDSNYRRALGRSLNKQTPTTSREDRLVEPQAEDTRQTGPLPTDQHSPTEHQTSRSQTAGPETENEESTLTHAEGSASESPSETNPASNQQPALQSVTQGGRPVRSDTQSTAAVDAQQGRLSDNLSDDTAFVGIEGAQQTGDVFRHIPTDLQPALLQPSAAAESRPSQADQLPASTEQLMPPESLFAVPENEHVAVFVTPAAETAVAADVGIVELSPTLDSDVLPENQVPQSFSEVVAGAEPNTTVAQTPSAAEPAMPVWTESTGGLTEPGGAVVRIPGLPSEQIVDTPHPDSRQSTPQLAELSIAGVPEEAAETNTIQDTLSGESEHGVQNSAVAGAVEPAADSPSIPHRSPETLELASAAWNDSDVLTSSESETASTPQTPLVERSVESQTQERPVMLAHPQPTRPQAAASKSPPGEPATPVAERPVFHGQSVDRQSAMESAGSGVSLEESQSTSAAVEQPVAHPTWGTNEEVASPAVRAQPTQSPSSSEAIQSRQQSVPVPAASGGQSTADVPLAIAGHSIATPTADAPTASENVSPAPAASVPGAQNSTAEVLARAPAGTAVSDLPADNTLRADETRPPVGVPGTGTSMSTAKTTGAAATPQLDDGRPMDLVNRVADAMRGMGPQGKQISVRLSPPELGTLQIEVSLRDGVLTAKMETQTATAQRAILDNLPQLKESLAQNGTMIDRFVVEHSDDRGKQDGAGSDHGSGSESQANDADRDQTPRDDTSPNDHDEVVERDDDVQHSVSSMDQLDIQV